MTKQDASLLAALKAQYTTNPAYSFRAGPLFDDPDYVLSCLRRYMAQAGLQPLPCCTVSHVAQCFVSDQYLANGEELVAVGRLLELGCGDRLVSPALSVAA